MASSKDKNLAVVRQPLAIDTLAENMGTSVAMIEKHYGHLKPELAADELIKE